MYKSNKKQFIKNNDLKIIKKERERADFIPIMSVGEHWQCVPIARERPYTNEIIIDSVDEVFDAYFYANFFTYNKALGDDRADVLVIADSATLKRADNISRDRSVQLVEKGMATETLEELYRQCVAEYSGKREKRLFVFVEYDVLYQNIILFCKLQRRNIVFVMNRTLKSLHWVENQENALLARGIFSYHIMYQDAYERTGFFKKRAKVSKRVVLGSERFRPKFV